MGDFIRIEQKNGTNGIEKEANVCALLYCAAGKAAVSCLEHTYPVKRGTVCFFSHTDAPKLQAGADFSAYFVQFRLDVSAHPFFAGLFSPFAKDTLLLTLDEKQTAFFDTVMGDMMALPTGTPRLAVRLFAHLLDLLAVCEPLFPARKEQMAPRAAHRIPEAVMRYVEENISRPLSLDDIANALFISKYHISHVFKRETGISVGEAVLRRKMEHAERLLAAGVPAHRVSEMVGFNYYSAFFRIYKRIKGHAPSKF